MEEWSPQSADVNYLMVFLLFLYASFNQCLTLGRKFFFPEKWHAQALETTIVKAKATPRNSEQEKKSSKLSISSVLETGAKISALVTTSGLLGPLTAIGGIATSAIGLTSQIAKYFGYNKPITLKAPTFVVPTTLDGMSYGSGLSVNRSLAIAPNNSTATQTDIYGMKVDHSQLVNLYTRPGLIEVWSFDSTKTQGEVIHTYYVTPATCATYNYVYTGAKNMYKMYMTPLSTVAYNFDEWRGDIKYFLYVMCSKFTVGRLRIAWHPTYSEIPAIGSSYTDGEGDFISAVLDFKGDTQFSFTVPYLQDFGMLPIADTYDKTVGFNGALSFSIVNPVTSNTSVGDSTVRVAVFIAGAPNMKFNQLKDRKLQDTTYTRGVWVTQGALPSTGWVPQSGEKMLCEIFESPFPSLIPAKTYECAFIYEGEQVLDVLTILHRPMVVPGSAGLISPLVSATWAQVSLALNVYNLNSDDPWNLFTQWFMYYRGSHNWKLLPAYQSGGNADSWTMGVTLGVYDYSNSAFVSPTYMQDSGFGRQGFLAEASSIKPSLEWTTPWVSATAFTEANGLGLFSTEETCSYIWYEHTGPGTVSASTFRLFHSVGDDFSLGCPFGCPVVVHYQQ